MNGPRRTACFAKGMHSYEALHGGSPAPFNPKRIMRGPRGPSKTSTDVITAPQSNFACTQNPLNRSCQTRHERMDGLTDNVQIFVSLRLLTSMEATEAHFSPETSSGGSNTLVCFQKV